MLIFVSALQGAARMTLQAGTHPAQLKDAVTSASDSASAVGL